LVVVSFTHFHDMIKLVSVFLIMIMSSCV